MKKLLKQDTRIEFDNSVIKGKGTIVGVSNNGLPILGISYIIELDEPINNEVYNYTHITLDEIYFKVI